MGVDIQKKICIFTIWHYFLFKVEQLWMQFLTRKSPLPIDIISWKIRPIIPTDHTIDIDHRHNFYTKILTQFLHLKPIGQQSS